MKYITYGFGCFVLALILILPNITEAQRFTTPVIPAAQIKITSPKTESTFMLGDRVMIAWTKAATLKNPVTVSIQGIGTPGTKNPIVLVASSTDVSYIWNIPKAELAPGKYELSVKAANVTSGPLFAKVNINIKAPPKPVLNPAQQIVTITETGSIDAPLKLRASLNGSNFKSTKENIIIVTSYGTGCTESKMSEDKVQGDVSGKKIDYDLMNNFFQGNNKACKFKVQVENANGLSNAIDLAFKYKGKITFNYPISSVVPTTPMAQFDKLSSEPHLYVESDVNGNTFRVKATIPFKVTAVGGDIKAPQPSDFEVQLVKDGLAVPAESVSLTMNPNTSIIKQNSSAEYHLSVMHRGPALKSGLYRAVVKIKVPSNIKELTTNTANVVSTNVPGSIQYTALGNQTLTAITNPEGETSSVTAEFGLRAKAVGGDVLIPTKSDFKIRLVAGDNSYSIPESDIVVTMSGTDSSYLYVTGVARTFYISATIAGAKLKSGLYKAILTTNTSTGTKEFETNPSLVTVASGSSSGVAKFDPVGQPTIMTSSYDQNGNTLGLVATFNLNVTAYGGDIPMPKSSDFNILFLRGSAAPVPASSIAVTTTPFKDISEGSTAQVTVNAALSRSALQSGLYTAKLVGLQTTIGPMDLETPNAAGVVRPTTAQAISAALQANVFNAFQGMFKVLFGF